MAIKATFKDYYSITKPTVEEIAEFKDYFASGGKKKLIIDMEATHAALPLNNPRFYIPSRMEAGTDSIEVGKSPMKILTHHDTSSMPVGITLAREYVPTIPQDLLGNPDVLVLTSPEASVKDQLKAMRNLKRTGVVDREDYRGLGHIKLRAEISQKDAVEALEDGRLDAISTNFDSPEEIYCSICAQNLAKDGWCEHERGEMYFADGIEEDGDMQFPCQWIPAVHDYLEASLVVLKGDPLAVVDIVDTKNEDKNETIYMSQDSVESGHSTFQFKDSVEEDPMLINGKKVTLSDAEQKLFDSIKKLHADMKDEEAYALMLDASKVMASEKFISDKAEADIDDEKAVLYVTKSLLSKDEELKANEICDGIRGELQAMKDEKLLTDEEFEAADAKISEDGLTKLPESAFCGPEKTFPVPDSAHATAAKRFVDKYEGPGDRTDILAQISIKAKAFGTDSKEETNNEPDTGEVEITSIGDSIKAMETDELRTLWHSVELELIDRKQVLVKPCSDCAVKTEEADAAKKELGEARDELTKAEDILSVLRSELRRAYTDYEDQVTEYVKLGAEFHTEKVEKLALVGVLTQKYDNLESATTELKDSDIDKISVSIMDTFDLKAVTEKLTDGMTNTPDSSVDDPTINPDGDNEQFSEGLSKAAEAAIDNIKDCLKHGDNSGAKRIYDTMNSFDLFPRDLTFESFSADKKDAE